MTFNLIMLTGLVLVESVQLLLAMTYVSTFFPSTSIFQAHTLPEWVSGLKPERELLLFRLFVFSAIVLMTVAVFKCKARMADREWGKRLRRFLITESLVLFAISYVVFKVLVYGHPLLKQLAWPFLICVAIGVKIFWKQLEAFGEEVMEFIHRPANLPLLRSMLDLGVPIFIALIIFTPNFIGIAARTYIGEQFHHINTLAMAPAWSYSMGSVLNRDVAGQYGTGMPILVGTLAKLLGGVTYEHVLMVLVGGCICYYWLCYAFLRMWFKSALIASIGVIIGIKWQMFHPGMYPFIFGIPNGLVNRYFLDIVFLILIYRHINHNASWSLLGASICAGVAVFYVTDDGSYLAITFCAYLLYLFMSDVFLKGVDFWTSAWRSVRYGVLTVMTVVGLFWIVLGNFLFTAQFRTNISEFIQFFLDGYEVLPMTKSFTDGQHLQGLMGFVIPGAYLFTLIVVVSLVFLRRISPVNILAAVLSVYGLCLHHYYVVRSVSTQYYVVCLPYVYILCFWLYHALARLGDRQRRNILMSLLVFCTLALVSTHQFLVYPNLLNISRNPLTDPLSCPKRDGGEPYFHHLFTPERIPEALKLPINSLGERDEGLLTEKDFTSDDELVDWYKKESLFTEDVGLIDGLVPPDGKLAIMGGEEILISMQANRKPFFYYFPLMVERPMRMRNFPSTHLHTMARLKKTLGQMEEEKPEYVFMDKIFLIKEIPRSYLFWSSDAVALINYVRTNYVPFKMGHYLVAMKRKAGL